MEAHKIVILGGGFAGLRTALEIEKRCKRLGVCEIILIDKQPAHLYTPLLYEVATGFLDDADPAVRQQLASGTTVRFEDFREIVTSRHITCRTAEVVGLDQRAQEVFLKGGDRVPYDDLVIAVGAETAFYGIRGMKTHAIPMKTLQDGMRVRMRIREFLSAYKQKKEKHISIVVGGGGATGTEVSAELGNLFQKFAAKGVCKPEDVSVTVVEAGPDILSFLPTRLREKAKKRLTRLGVGVMTDTKVTSVEANAVHTESAGKKQTLEADVMIWCGGIQPSAVIQKLGLKTGEKGHLDVDASFRVRGTKRIYALGDCAQFALKQGGYAPALAQVAIRQAGTVAENLIRHVEGKNMKQWHTPRRWPVIVPLGGKYGVASIGPISLAGFTAYVLHKTVDLRYWLQTLSPASALRVWVRGAKTYIQNDG